MWFYTIVLSKVAFLLLEPHILFYIYWNKMLKHTTCQSWRFPLISIFFNVSDLTIKNQNHVWVPTLLQSCFSSFTLNLQAQDGGILMHTRRLAIFSACLTLTVNYGKWCHQQPTSLALQHGNNVTGWTTWSEGGRWGEQEEEEGWEDAAGRCRCHR